MAGGLFGGGNGLINNPYIVEDAADFDAVRNGLDSYYLQGNDIDMDVYPYNEDGFEPISANIAYDGGGFTINNLFIFGDGPRTVFNGGISDNKYLRNINLKYLNVTSNDAEASGLTIGVSGIEVTGSNVEGAIQGVTAAGFYIGFVSGPVNISECSFKGYVTGSDVASGFTHGISGSVTDCHADSIINSQVVAAGFITNSESIVIDRCTAKGTIDTGVGAGFGLGCQEANIQRSSSEYIITSYNDRVTPARASGFYRGTVASVTISKCYANCEIIDGGNSLIGSGFLDGVATISECYALGSITGFDTCGGFAGALSGTIVIKDSFSDVDMATGGSTVCGGFIGSDNASSSSIEDCYSASILNPSGFRGGFTGSFSTGHADYVGNNYWDIERANFTSSQGGPNTVGLTTAAMKYQGSYVGWNFTGVWYINRGEYPSLLWTYVAPEPEMKLLTIKNPTSDGNRVETISITKGFTGVGGANKIPITGEKGYLNAGLFENYLVAQASEVLTIGSIVNVIDIDGTLIVRKASAMDNTKPGFGFVLDNYSIGDTAVIYPFGINSGLTGLTPGKKYYLSSSVAGEVVSDPPALSGNIVQAIGIAITSSILRFSIDSITEV